MKFGWKESWRVGTTVLLGLTSACSPVRSELAVCQETMEKGSKALCIALLGDVNEVVGVGEYSNGTEIIVSQMTLDQNNKSTTTTLGHGAVKDGKFGFPYKDLLLSDGYMVATAGSYLCLAEEVWEVDDDFVVRMKCENLYLNPGDGDPST